MSELGSMRKAWSSKEPANLDCEVIKKNNQKASNPLSIVGVL